MSIAVLGEIVNRLNDKTKLSKVTQAMHLRNVLGASIAGQAQAWVIELSSLPTQSLDDIGAMVQVEPVRYGVVIGLKTTNDPEGTKSLAKLEALRHYVRQQLFDWQPNPEHDAFELDGSELLHIEAAAIYWVERFNTQHTITKENLL